MKYALKVEDKTVYHKREMAHVTMSRTAEDGADKTTVEIVLNHMPMAEADKLNIGDAFEVTFKKVSK